MQWTDNKTQANIFNTVYSSQLWQKLGRPPALGFPDPLFYQGNLDLLRLPLVGIVGARHPTMYGRRIAMHFAEEIAKAGLCVVSGGAIGIDGIANRAALKNGNSIAIVGGGILNPYPPSNKGLFEELASSPNGLLLSQFPQNEVARPWHFPKRNVTLAALCDYVLVIEAGLESGSLITAKAATELGTDVGAIPGSVEGPLSKGVNSLISEGAFCVQSPFEVVERVLQQRQLRSHPSPKLNHSSLLF